MAQFSPSDERKAHPNSLGNNFASAAMSFIVAILLVMFLIWFL
jgi:flagellar biogenesis protein FliO